MSPHVIRAAARSSRSVAVLGSSRFQPSVIRLRHPPPPASRTSISSPPGAVVPAPSSNAIPPPSCPPFTSRPPGSVALAPSSSPSGSPLEWSISPSFTKFRHRRHDLQIRCPSLDKKSGNVGLARLQRVHVRTAFCVDISRWTVLLTMSFI